MRITPLVSAIALVLPGVAAAQTCAAYPNQLTNGQTADANAVMGDFNCAVLLAQPSAIELGSNTEKLSLNSGSVGLNRRVVDGHIYNTSEYAFQLQHIGTGTAGTDLIEFQVYAPAGGAVTDAALAINGAGQVSINATPTTAYEFYVNGTAAGTANWVNASDGRLKKHIAPLRNGLDLVQRLNPVSYEWRAPGERTVGRDLALPMHQREIGFIGQQVESVVPEAVAAPKSDDSGFYGLKEAALVPVLVAAVKEQQAEIARQQSEIDALKVRISKLAAARRN